MKKYLSGNINFFEEISKQRITRVEKGIGSFFTIFLGSLRSELINDPIVNEERTIIRGAIELWIYLCDWKIYKNEQCLLTSDNIDNDNCSTLQSLLDLKILKFEFVKKIEIVISFTNNYQLVLSRGNDYHDKDDMFQLSTKKNVYSYNSQEGLLSEKK